jgi:hypothetical protein
MAPNDVVHCSIIDSSMDGWGEIIQTRSPMALCRVNRSLEDSELGVHRNQVSFLNRSRAKGRRDIVR